MPKFPKSNRFSQKFCKKTPFKKEGVDFVAMGGSGVDKEGSGSFIDPSKNFTDYSDRKKPKKLKGGEEEPMSCAEGYEKNDDGKCVRSMTYTLKE